MPDFATPPGASSPAHTQLAVVVWDPLDDMPVRLVALAWFTCRLTQINTAAAPFHIQMDPDQWWGHISRHAIVLDDSEAPSAGRSSWHS